MLFKPKRTMVIISIAISVITLLLIASNIYGADSHNPGPPPGPAPTLRQAELYANRLGITVDEALNRFKLMNSFPGLERVLSAKESGAFGGLWIQHEPDFRVVVAFTHNGKEILTKYLPPSFPPYIDVRSVSTSYIDLKNIHRKFRDELDKLHIRSISGVYVAENKVKFDILKTDGNIYSAAIQNKNISLPDKVIIDYIDDLPHFASTVYGGMAMSSPTTGFSVENEAGTRGILTCGHGSHNQGVTSAENGYVKATYQGGVLGGDYDYGWYTCQKDTTITNNCLFDYNENGPQVAPVTGIKAFGDQRVGEIVCKFGRMTNLTCGTIKSLFSNVTLTDPWDNTSRNFNLVQVDNYFGYSDLVQQGDSGGPWFMGDGESGLTAIGITSGYSGSGPNQYGYYMPVDRISGSGIRILTQ